MSYPEISRHPYSKMCNALRAAHFVHRTACCIASLAACNARIVRCFDKKSITAMFVRYALLPYLDEIIPPLSRWDFLFYSAEFIRWPSTLGTREAQLEQASASGGARRPARLSCGPCIVCWQDGINPYIISVLLSSGTPSGLLARRSAPSGTELKILFFAFSS